MLALCCEGTHRGSAVHLDKASLASPKAFHVALDKFRKENRAALKDAVVRGLPPP